MQDNQQLQTEQQNNQQAQQLKDNPDELKTQLETALKAIEEQKKLLEQEQSLRNQKEQELKATNDARVEEELAKKMQEVSVDIELKKQFDNFVSYNITNESPFNNPKRLELTAIVAEIAKNCTNDSIAKQLDALIKNDAIINKDPYQALKNLSNEYAKANSTGNFKDFFDRLTKTSEIMALPYTKEDINKFLEQPLFKIAKSLKVETKNNQTNGSNQSPWFKN